MKKSALSLSIILGLSISSKAQDHYFPFKLNGKFGITDSTANEIVKPQYKYYTTKPDNIALLQNFDATKDLLFNRITGKIQSGEYIQGEQIKIADKHYSLLQNNKKSQLLEVTTGKTIPLNEEYHEMKNEGKYIVAKYYPHAKPTPKPTVDKQVWKKGVPPPPPVMPAFAPLDGLTVFNNSLPLTKALDGPYREYIILYKNNEEKTTARNDDPPLIVTAQTIIIEPWSQATSPDFYAILLRSFKTNSLYSYDLKLIDSFKEQDYSKEQLVAKARKILNLEVSDWDSRPSGSTGMISAPPDAPYNAQNKPAARPKINYPVLSVTQLNTGYEQVVLQQSEEIRIKLFRTKGKVSIAQDKITLNNNKESEFTVNMKTGKVRLPKKYWSLLGLAEN